MPHSDVARKVWIIGLARITLLFKRFQRPSLDPVTITTITCTSTVSQSTKHHLSHQRNRTPGAGGNAPVAKPSLPGHHRPSNFPPASYPTKHHHELSTGASPNKSNPSDRRHQAIHWFASFGAIQDTEPHSECRNASNLLSSSELVFHVRVDVRLRVGTQATFF